MLEYRQAEQHSQRSSPSRPRRLCRGSLQVSSWGAFFAPKGTPRAIVDKFAAAVARANQDPVMRDYAASFGADPASSTPDELGVWVKREIERLCIMTKKAGIRME